MQHRKIAYLVRVRIALLVKIKFVMCIWYMFCNRKKRKKEKTHRKMILVINCYYHVTLVYCYYVLFFRSVPHTLHLHLNTRKHTNPSISSIFPVHLLFISFALSFARSLFFFLTFSTYHCCDWIELNIQYILYCRIGEKKVILQIVYRCLLFQAIQFRSKSVDELSAHEIQVNETDFIESYMTEEKKQIERIIYKKENNNNNNSQQE